MSDRSVSVHVRPAGGGSWHPLSWTRLYARKSMDEICHSFEIETAPIDRRWVHKHDLIYIAFNRTVGGSVVSRPVTSGFIDDVTYLAKGRGKRLSLTGRSPARDLVDSRWSGQVGKTEDGRTESISALNAFREVVKRFRNIRGEQMRVFHIPQTANGVEVDYTRVVPTLQWENESPWPKMLQIAASQGFILTSSQIGDVYVTWLSGTPRKGFAIEEGRSASVTRDEESGLEQYHTYVFNAVDTRRRSLTSSYEDQSVASARILEVNLTEPVESQQQLDRRVQTEYRRRNHRRVTVTVNDWGLSEQQLLRLGSLSGREIFWEVNCLTPVTLPSIGIDTTVQPNGGLITSQVEYNADARSMTCNVTLVNRETYE